MPYVYENHLNGGFYTSDEELSVGYEESNIDKFVNSIEF